MKRFFFILGLLLIGLLTWKAIDQYVLCPTYAFSEPLPFRGHHIYNPYENMHPNDVVPANFHAHVRTWGGLTNGKGDAHDVYRRYDSMGYAFHAVSQYHHIDTVGKGSGVFIPAYEHGYNIKKTHQLVIGARQVLWKDYVFPQTIHNKQEILLQLSKDPENIIVLNHPTLRDGYGDEELKRLHYFDYIELLNPAAQSIRQWDVMLSAGKKVYAMGNDDFHDVFNNDALGRFLTLVFDTKGNVSDLYKSLKKGASIAVWLPQIERESLVDKSAKINALKNVLKQVSVNKASLKIQLARPFQEIRVISDMGRIKKVSRNTAVFSASFQPEETYWRVELVDADGTKIFLNPFYRVILGQNLARNEIGSLSVSRDQRPARTAYVFIGFLLIWVFISYWRYTAKSITQWFRLQRRARLTT